jgi:hypothetical protein
VGDQHVAVWVGEEAHKAGASLDGIREKPPLPWQRAPFGRPSRPRREARCQRCSVRTARSKLSLELQQGNVTFAASNPSRYSGWTRGHPISSPRGHLDRAGVAPASRADSESLAIGVLAYCLQTMGSKQKSSSASSALSLGTTTKCLVQRFIDCCLAGEQKSRRPGSGLTRVPVRNGSSHVAATPPGL